MNDIKDNNKEKTSVSISKRLVYINSISSIVTRLLNIFVLVWMYEYLLRRISSEEFAIYPVVASIMVFAPLFSALFTGGLSRHVIDAYAKGDEKRVSQIVSSIVPLLGSVCLVLFILGMLFSWNIHHVFNIADGQIDDARLMMAMLIFMFLLDTSLLPYSVGFHVKQKYILLNAIRVSADLIKIALLFILMLGVGPKVLWVVVAAFVSKMVSIFAINIISCRLVPQLKFRPSLFDWKVSREIMSFGLWTTVSQIANMIYQAAGTLVLNKFGTSVDVTNYHIGTTFHRQINNMTIAASAPVMPALTAMNALNDEKRLANAYLRGGRFALWVMLLMAAPLMIYSSEFIQLYIGNVYADTAIVMVFIMGVYPITASNTMLSKLAIAKAHLMPFAIGSISVNLVNLGVMIYLAKYYNVGAAGIAASVFAATIISQFLIFLPMGMYYAKVPVKRYLLENLIPGLVPAIVGSLIWFGLKFLHTPQTWFELGAFVALGLAGYGIIMLLYLMKYEADLIRLLLEPAQKILKKVRK